MKKLKNKLRKMKQVLSLVLAAAAVCGTMTAAAPAFAAGNNDFPGDISRNNYAEVISPQKINCYRDSGLTARGTCSPAKSYNSYIDPGDNLKVLEITPSYARVLFPTSSGYKEAFVRTSDLFGVSSPTEHATADAKFTTYTTSARNRTSGSVFKGEDVWKLGTFGSSVMILYPADSGSRGYKAAFISKNTYSNYCTPVGTNDHSGMKDVTASFAGKTVTLRSIENGRYVASDGNLTGTPLVANRTAASTWETFTVSNLTPDGWVGLKAYNGKWVSAMNDTANVPLGCKYDNLLSWECFRIYMKDGCYYIKAQANNKWLCVRMDLNGNPVQAYADVPSTWERIDIKAVSTSSKNNSADTWQYPFVNGKATCTWDDKTNMSWGGRNTDKEDRQFHLGIDIYPVDGNTTVVAAADGKVVKASSSNQGANGRYVVIEHDVGGKKIYSFYAHLSSVKVAADVTVSKGEPIGVVGGSGDGRNNRYGTHLHFAIVDALRAGTYYGYSYKFSGNKHYFNNMTFYNPVFVIENDRLPG